MEERIAALEKKVAELERSISERVEEMRDFKDAIEHAASPYWMSRQYKGELEQNLKSEGAI